MTPGAIETKHFSSLLPDLSTSPTSFSFILRTTLYKYLLSAHQVLHSMLCKYYSSFLDYHCSGVQSTAFLLIETSFSWGVFCALNWPKLPEIAENCLQLPEVTWNRLKSLEGPCKLPKYMPEKEATRYTKKAGCLRTWHCHENFARSDKIRFRSNYCQNRKSNCANYVWSDLFITCICGTMLHM